MFIPFTVAMIPNYLLIAKLNLIDTTWGVIIPQFADAMGIFIDANNAGNSSEPSRCGGIG